MYQTAPVEVKKEGTKVKTVHSNTLLEWIVAVILVVGVGLSRIYFGVHSISQIILGASMSWLCFELMTTIKPVYKKSLKKLEKSDM